MIPQAPKGPRPLKWILFGFCGLLVMGVLGAAGCGAAFYFIYKASDPVAEVGAEYLQKHEHALALIFSEGYVVKRKLMDWKVEVLNDGGNARIGYTITGKGPPANAVVWLVRIRGTWSAMGALAKVKGEESFTLGTPPSEYLRFRWDE